MKAMWKSSRDDPYAAGLVVVVLAYTYLKSRGIDDVAFLGVAAGWFAGMMMGRRGR